MDFDKIDINTVCTKLGYRAWKKEEWISQVKTSLLVAAKKRKVLFVHVFQDLCCVSKNLKKLVYTVIPHDWNSGNSGKK